MTTTLKVVLVGESGSGKSTIMYQFMKVFLNRIYMLLQVLFSIKEQ